MDSNSLENIFKENMWVINQLYKLLVLIVYIGGPLTALFVLFTDLYQSKYNHFYLSYYIIEFGYCIQIRSIAILFGKLFLDLF